MTRMTKDGFPYYVKPFEVFTRRWIARNNPYPVGSMNNIRFAIAYWADQIAAIWTWKRRWPSLLLEVFVLILCILIGLVALMFIIAMIFGGVS